MYLWRVSIAVTLGLVWYFSDCGRVIAQYFLCFLFCFTTPLVWGNAGRESSTQTDEHSQERSLLETIGEQLFGDLSDGACGSKPEPLESQYPQVKGSLQQVFECAYAQLVLPWYIVPEPCEDQPLHQVLSREFDFVIDRIIDRAKDFDVSQAVVGSIRILTQHLHNAKQSDSSRAEEVAVLREFSDALVRNLFPKSLWGHEVNHCALNEIVALKGLGLLVSWLSDPDNLNHLVVSQLDSASPKGSVYEPHGLDPDQTSLMSQDYEADVEHEGEGSEVSLEGIGLESCNGIKGKKRDKLRKGWNRFVDKMKLKRVKKKRMKQMEHELVRRIMAIQGDVSNEEDVSSREGSVHSQQDSDREDSDLENYLTSVREDMMEFKLSYEMWRAGQWAVSIPQADVENEEIIFTVHLEEKGSPENLQWDIRKSYHDVIHFYNRWQDSSSLPTILILEENQEMDEVKEETRLSVEHFLQEVVSDEIIGHSQPVFQFLCPLDKLLNEEVHYGGVWGLLSGLAYFLTPGQEEEEMGSQQNEFPKEVTMSQSKSKSPPDSPSISSESDSSSPAIPTIIISPCDTPEEPPKENEAENESPSATTSAQDRTEDSDNPITSHFKMLFKGLSRSKSQESLSQKKIFDDEEQCSQNGEAETAEETSTQHSVFTRSNKKEKISFKVSNGPSKTKTKDQGTLPRGEDSPGQKGQANWEQQETTKVIFDLLKEISGNSILLNIFDAILKPVMPILKKKINSFLNKMNPTEAQMAVYIDTLRAKLWPSSPAAPSAPRTEEEKNETRERAHSLINAKYSNVLVLKKTDMETVFNIFQDSEANKTLVYMLLSFLLREFLPNEHCLNVSTAALQKVTNN
ncbi:uncharacterized protein si:rp71-46j2.7 isoform X2 [Periophthalmus magnuspinnatus]|uniref:uncharacterized protein si:rp71-46j2.7 isoform X2 n=1 Tax=Periophthalmus magnuspinnatus TaxID=409849 RepID=UPI0024363BBF|nr:uncharacterized protein si:rp71-46j2.7 isoform X2 [Periophthalmus magnuspinnatus]